MEICYDRMRSGRRSVGLSMLPHLYISQSTFRMRRQDTDNLEKTRKQWRVPHKMGPDAREWRVIQPGDSGIWATCNKGKERQCIGELRDLFNEYAEILYGDVGAEEKSGPSADDMKVMSSAGIESEIKDEIVELQQPSLVQLFTPVRIEVQCGESACR